MSGWSLGPEHPDHGRATAYGPQQPTRKPRERRVCAYTACGREFVVVSVAPRQRFCSQSCSARERWRRHYDRDGHDLRSCGCLACSEARRERGITPLIGASA